MSNNMNDTIGTARDGMGAAADAASKVIHETSSRAAEVAGRVKEAGHQAANYMRDECGHLRQEAHHAYDRARDKAVHWEHSIESRVQRRPLESLLIAAGVGMLIGLLWKRHD
jgi:ElaB/YqjD/DUF883 family membrane-anchored ribosome-binding protein